MVTHPTRRTFAFLFLFLFFQGNGSRSASSLSSFAFNTHHYCTFKPNLHRSSRPAIRRHNCHRRAAFFGLPLEEWPGFFFFLILLLLFGCRRAAVGFFESRKNSFSFSSTIVASSQVSFCLLAVSLSSFPSLSRYR